FCASSALIAGLALAVVFATVSVASGFVQSADVSEGAASPQPASGQSENLVPAIDSRNSIVVSGVITDEHCGARHELNSGMNSAECAQQCVRQGSSYMLVNGDKKYRLEGKSDEISKFAGQRAALSGALTGKTIRVASVWSPE